MNTMKQLYNLLRSETLTQVCTLIKAQTHHKMYENGGQFPAEHKSQIKCYGEQSSITLQRISLGSRSRFRHIIVSHHIQECSHLAK